jgi:hypothetical protein
MRVGTGLSTTARYCGRASRRVPHHQRLQRYYPPFFEPFLKGLDERRADVRNAYLRAVDLYVIVRPDAEPALIEPIISVPGATKLSTAGDARVCRLPRRLSVGDR